MRIECCIGETAWVAAADQWVQDQCRKAEVRRIFLPAGETPKPLYAFWEKEKPAYLRQITFVQIDDVATGPQRGVFKSFFEKHLPSFGEQFEYFSNGEKGADLALLGLGMNGHVAFHEPGLSSEFYSGCVELTPATLNVLQLQAPTWGATYGLKAFKNCKGILMLVRGEKKRGVLERVLARDQSLPAVALTTIPDFTVLADFKPQAS